MWSATAPLQQLVCGLGLIAARLSLEVPWVSERLQPSVSAAEEQDFADSGPEIAFGRRCFRRMPYQRWCRLYVTTSPGKGYVVLMIAEVRPQSGVWACVNPYGRLEQISTRNRLRVSSRGKADVKYVDVLGYTHAQLEGFERIARDLVHRAGGQP